MKLLRTTLFFFISSVLSLALFVAPVQAQESWATPSIQDVANAIQETVDGVIQKEGSETHSIFTSQIVLGCEIGGCAEETDAQGKPQPFRYSKSAIAAISKGIEYVYANPPATSYAFAVDVGKTFGFLPRSYAQGFGFGGLQPLLGIWKAFRNIAYGIIAIIMIVIGFMVMLRKKIDPKTVVTVQNSIPRIVVALILVTFSYAIAGFMIDLMYVLMLLIANMLIPIAGINDQPNTYITSGFWRVLITFLSNGYSAFWDIFRLIPDSAHWIALGIGGVIGFFMFGLQMFGLKAIATAGAPHALFFLLIMLTVLFGFVRLFFLLLDAYIHIIISVIVSPLQLVVEALPGTNALSSWMRNFVSKLLVFPLVTALLLITSALTSDQATGKLWAPPYLADPTASSGPEGNSLMGLISLGMLLSIPSIVAGVQKMLKAEPVVPGGVAAITGPLGGSLGQLFNLVYQGSFIRSAFRKDHGPSPYQQAVSGGNAGLGGIVKGPGGQGH